MTTIESNFKVMCANLPLSYCKLLQLLKDKHFYTSKSSIIRISLRDFFLKEIPLIQALRDYEILNEIALIPNIIEFKKQLSIFEFEMNKRFIREA